MRQAHPLAGQLAGPMAPTRPWPDHVAEMVLVDGIDTEGLEAELRRAPREMWTRYSDNKTRRGRANGILNDNAVFGWTPPFVARRREFCAPCGPNSKAPGVMRELVAIGAQLDRLLAEHRPDEHSRLHATSIGPDWVFPGTAWTSAIINDSAQLPYHLDGGNTKGTWSAMVVLRRFVRGGHLHLPELGLVAACRNRQGVLFNGQSNLHGVTPFVPERDDGYRWTVVFYQRSGMTGCGDPAEELRRQQVARTKREELIAPGQAGKLEAAAKARDGQR